MPTFILGAGFNLDATSEAGPIFGESLHDQIDCGYPLVGDALRLCFELDRAPDGKSVEDLFANASERGDYGPLRRLAGCLRKADFYIARSIASDKKLNCYRRFFRTFAGSNFLTFNYDSLPETLLFQLERWFPHDGYGLPVATRVLPWSKGFDGKKSSSLVLHLHGSLCIRTSEYEARRERGEGVAWLTKRDEPLYSFDPRSIPANFRGFDAHVGTDDIESRIIAPIPDKSRDLEEPFIRGTNENAEAMVRASDKVVAIGYSFNHYDRASYQRLLHALGKSTGRRLVVVSPDAGTIANSIRPCFPDLSIEAVDATFREWTAASFPGLVQRR